MKLFKWKNVGVRRKNRKFEARIPHFYCMEYYEKGKKMILYIDFRDPVLDFSMEYITHWEPPYEDIVLSPRDKKRIYRNVSEYLKGNFGEEHVNIR